MMAFAWMSYCLLVSLLLGTAALAAERGLRLYRLPARWVWPAAMVGSTTFPAFMYAFPVAHPVMREPLVPVIEAIAGASGLSASSIANGRSPLPFATIDDLLLIFCALTSAMVSIYFVRSYLQLRGERRRWSTAAIGVSEVFVSARLGPAVCGVFRSWIVIPAWVLDLDEDVRRLILLHEQEHLRAGDHRLLFTAVIALAVMPWNLPLWWQLRRLRLATELDCDRRVLRRGVDTRTYGELLLEVGHRSASPSFLPAAFAEPRSFLEERVRNMIEKVPDNRRRKFAIAATIAASLTAIAFLAPSPMAGGGSRSTTGTDASRSQVGAAPQDTTKPRFTPYTVGPDLKNRGAAVSAVERFYPDSLKKSGIGGTVSVWVYIDEQGDVRETRVAESSRIDALDQAALAAASEFEFTPALNEDRPVPVWVQIPIVFSALSGGPTETAKFRLRSILRMIATLQEHQYQETGEYFQSLDAILEQVRQAREQGMQAITPNENEKVSFEVKEGAWAAVVRNGELECAMYYGEIAAPRDYAKHGKAVCK